MTASELIERASGLGIRLWVEGDRLRYDAPEGAMNGELRNAIVAQRAEIVSRLAAPSLRRIAQKVLPLSFAQQRLWLLEQLEPGSSSYHSYGAVRLIGQLDVAAVGNSVAEIVRRHEALRTTFHQVDGNPEQRISDALDVRVEHEDYRALQPAGRMAAALACANALRARPFDLTRGPLLRVALLRVDEQEHLLVVVFHHIVCDGWSVAVFTRELTSLYEAYTAGRLPSLPELTIQYPDYTQWQRACLAGSRLDAELSFWREQLSGVQTLDLPTDRTRRARPSGAGAEEHVELSAELTTALEDLSRAENATLFMTLLTAFNVLLARYARQTDIVVGVPVANRPRPELEALIGFFVNMLVVRTDVSGDPTFRELLKRVRERSLAAFAHQDVPFDLLVQELQPARELTRTPYFQVTFGLQNMPPAALQLPGVVLETARLDNPTTRFDLELHAVKYQGTLRLQLNYSTDLFDAATIRHMLGAYRTLLLAVVQQPGAVTSELSLLDDVTRARIAAWNATTFDYPRTATIHRLFEVVAARQPNSIAVVFADRQLTYAQLNAEANRLARHLRSCGVGDGSFVGFCLERSTRTVVTMLAILKAGGVYVPLDPDYPEDRLRFMVDDVAATVVVTERRLSPLMVGTPVQLVILDDEWPHRQADYAGDNLDWDSTATDLAYVIYTSGSTGRPKGVCVRHRGVVRLVVAANYLQITPEDSVAQGSNSSFDAATFEVWGALLNGARLVGLSQSVMLAPSVLAERLAHESITVLWLTSALFNAVAREVPRAFNSIRAMLVGGEKVDAHSVRSVLRHGGPGRLLNGYGPTETTTFAATYHVRSLEDRATSVPIGRGISQTRLHVLDDRREPVPIGMAGELYIAGDGVAAGYWQRPDLTADRFVSLPKVDDGTLYRTGDLVRWNDDGQIEFIGRNDGQVKLRGFRIELGEIEAALRTHRGVADVTVVLREDGSDRRLVAYVVGHGDDTLAWDALRAHLRVTLPPYMTPAAFVQMDALPVNANGKIDRRALPPPAAERLTTNATYVAPNSAIEEQITAIWKQLLELDRIGIEDNFFDLGGHSLLLIRVHARITEVLNRNLPIVDLFEFPTVASLAAHLSKDPAQRAAPDRALPAATAASGGHEPIAIIGMAGRFPGAPDLDVFWDNLRNGVESIHVFSADELAAAGVAAASIADPRYVRARGVLDGVELFDAEFFGFTPREAEIMDPQHRLFLECAWEALEAAGYDPDRYPGAIGIAAGSNFNSYLGNLAANPELLAAVGGVQSLISVASDFLTTRVSYKLNLRGPSLNVQTACSTSMVAVHVACRSLAMGDCDIALAGGVSVTVPQIRGHMFVAGGIASPDGHCRAFDINAQGTVPGNGVGVVVLKRLSAALADGDQIHAVILGAAVNNDGAHKVGFTAPGVEGQADVVARALREANIEPGSVSYIEAHGTGTALGDPIEITALTRVYGTDAEKRCAIGSLKTNVGHLDAAAGIGGLIKTVLALKHQELPPTLHFERPNPKLGLETSPFYVNTGLQPWQSVGPRRAGTSSFGIGGTNAHVVLEEAPAIAPSSESRDWQVLCLSARTPDALAALAARHAAYIDGHREVPLADIAYTLNVGRRAFSHRRAVICTSHADAVEQLRSARPPSRLSGAVAAGEPSCVFMFTGQGSQSVGMFREFYHAETAFRADVDECCEQLIAELGKDVRELLFAAHTDEAVAAAINQTEFAQPILFVVEYALARLLMRWGVTPDALIGHSLGEYVAACLAGVFSCADALRLVAARGRLMQAMAPGAMLAVTLGEEQVRAMLPPVLSLAAVNALHLTVVAGPLPSIAEFEARLSASGVGCQRLKTSHAFHSHMMELAPPRIPVVSNVTGTWITHEDAVSPSYWVQHLRATVRFADGLTTLLAQPRCVLLEVGNGEALSALARMQAAPAAAVISTLPRQASGEVASVLSAVAALWVAGVKVDWAAVYQGERRLRVTLPTYPFERRRHWVDRPATNLSVAPQRLPMEQWLLRPAWQRRTPDAHAIEPQRWLVLADTSGVSARISAALRRRGADVVTMVPGPTFDRCSADHFTFNPAVPQDYQRVIEALAATDRVPTVVAHCLGVTSGVGDQSTHHDLERGFYSVMWLEQAFGQAGWQRPRRLAVVTSGAVAVAHGDAVSPGRAAGFAPVLVIPAEHPHVTSCAVDLIAAEWLDAADDSVDSLLAQLASGDERSVAYRDGQMWTPYAEPLGAEPAAHASRLRDSGVYLVTGAFGGIGRSLSRHLAERYRAKLVLIGRSALPERASWPDYLATHSETDRINLAIRHVEELESLGAHVIAATADVADAAAMKDAIDTATRQWGAINGVIHAAGLAGGGVVHLKEREAAARVLAPKVDGTEVLAHLVDHRSLDFMVLCSSLASVLGGAGQVDYCAANAFLDAFAHEHTRRTGVFTVAINWDTWRDVGMAVNTDLPSQLESRREAALDRAMTPHEGIEIFERVLSLSSASQVLVSTIEWGSRIGGGVAASPAAATEAAPASAASGLQAPAGALSADQIEQTILAVWQNLLGIEAIARTDNFFELGGHSLLLLQAQTALSQKLRREVPVTTLFQYSTVAALTEHLALDGPVAAAVSTTTTRSSTNAIAVVGLAARLPGAADAEQFWANLRDGVESIEFCTDEELTRHGVDQQLLSQPNYVKAASIIEDVEWFDADLFGYTPREAEMLDPQQRVFLECAWQALEHAGCDPARYDGRIGVFAGASSNSYYQNIASNPDVLRSAGAFQAAMGSKSDFLPSRVSYKLNLRGPSVNVQTACSTSLVAVHQACRSLIDGDCTMAVAGGVSINVPVKSGYLYHAEGILSPDGHCRAFDADARGTVPASGAGVVVVMRLEDALAAGHTIHAVIRGTAINNDGAAKVGFTAPSVSGQAAVIARAQEVAGVTPDEVSYVEAHGTGTSLGDPIEVAALTLAFGPGPAGSCALGTVKSNLGHLDAAAGVAGLIKTILALQHRQLPPSLHFRAANPQIDFASGRFFVNTTARDWPAPNGERIAGVSSFGIGGTNAHAIVQQPPAMAASGPSRDWQVLVVSGKTEGALEGNRAKLASYLAGAPAPLADVASTLQRGRTPLPHRLAIVCRDAADAVRALNDPRRARDLTAVAPDNVPSCVLMFSGQGTQHAGMARELYDTEPGFRADVDACADLVDAATGEDIRESIFATRGDQQSSARLRQTAIAQPALFAIEYAMAQLWMRWGIRPAALIGHSLGEYVAACVAGVFSLEEAVALVVARGRALQRMPEGAMLAVSMPESELASELPEALAIAALNAPSACVVSGPTDAIDRFAEDLGARGVNCRRLQTSHAFHSAMMDAALDEFRAAVEKTTRRAPQRAMVSNLTGTWLTAQEATSVDYWVQHVRRAVRFADGVRTLAALSSPIFIEVGPGRTLATFVGQVLDTPRTVTSLPHPQQSRSAVEHTLEAVAHLWVAGVAIDWPAVSAHEQRRLVPLPTYTFQRQRYWIDTAATAMPRVALPVSVTKVADTGAWCYVPTWQRSVPSVTRQIAVGEICLLFEDQQGLGDALSRQLVEAGCAVVRVRVGPNFARVPDGSYTINPAQPDDYDALLGALHDADADPSRVAHLWAVDSRPAPQPGDDHFERTQDATFYSVLFLTQALVRRGLDAVDLAVVGEGWATLGRDDVVQPAKSPLLALCTVISQEHPGIRTAAIDVKVSAATIDRVAEQIVRELRADFDGMPIAYRGPQRWVQAYERITTATGWSGALRARGVYVITGGLGNVGFALARHLAHSHSARLVLIGRALPPPRDLWDAWVETHGHDDRTSQQILALKGIEAAGGELLLRSADVSDTTRLRAVFAEARDRFGSIDGVIHAAGETTGAGIGPITAMDRSACEAQFRSKVHGLAALAEVLLDHRPAFCVLTSSLSAVLGGLGFAAYAAANRYMDAFAEAADHRDMRWISVASDAWAFTASARSALSDLAMTAHEGVEVMQRVIESTATPRVILSTASLDARLERYVRREARHAAPTVPALATYARPSTSDYEPPADDTERMLADVWQQMIGIDRVGRSDDFFKLGGHSLLATRIILHVKQRCGVELALKSFFERPTLSELAGRVSELQWAAESRAASVGVADREEIEI
jgi:amino acid adenylation domain-containing protein